MELKNILLISLAVSMIILIFSVLYKVSPGFRDNFIILDEDKVNFYAFLHELEKDNNSEDYDLTTSNKLCRMNSKNYFSKIPFVKLLESKELKGFIKNKKVQELPKNTILVVLDNPFKSTCVSNKNFENFLDNENISLCIAENWFDKENKKFRYWPIGLESKMIKNKQKLVKKIDNMNKSKTKIKKKYILSNAHFFFYKKPASGWENEREDMFNKLKKSKKIDFWKNKKSQEQTLISMKRYLYNLSPSGNGLDCHRTYESYWLNIKPVVKDGPLTPLYKKFPNIKIVKDWKEVEDLPKEEETENNYEMIELGFWLNEYLRDRCEFVYDSKIKNRKETMRKLLSKKDKIIFYVVEGQVDENKIVREYFNYKFKNVFRMYKVNEYEIFVFQPTRKNIEYFN